MQRPGAIPVFCLPKIRGGATSKIAVEETKNRASSKEIRKALAKIYLRTTCKIQFLYGHRLEHRCKILKNRFGGNATEFENTYTNRSPLGHYLLLPNEIFTLGLSPGELSAYAYLMYCEDRETHQCWPSIGRICQHTGMSANTVAKYIRQLEEKQLINVEPTKVRTKAGEVRNGTLQFTIRPI